MIKVAMIGAGSVVFSKTLTGDILTYPEFRNATFSYMDIDQERLEVGAALCRKVGKALGADPKIEATRDRRAALAGADYVINMVQIGGFDSTLVDFEIPRKYGLNFTIADTTGPGGFFRALRTYPMLKGLCADMMAVCPRAVLLNYSNPMSMNMQTIFRTSDIQAVGLCHSVQGTLNQLCRYVGVDPHTVSFICAGINHMAFYTRLEKDGVDLYPAIFEAMKRPEVYSSNKVRFEIMKRLGYFVTESSEHNAEYCPWFIPHGQKRIDTFGVPIDEYLRRCDGIVEEFERMKGVAASSEPLPVPHRTHEYGSTIIHSMVTGTPSVVYGNVRNRGAISSLPYDAIAEGPTLVDRAGLQLTNVGALPPQLVAYMNPHVTQHELFIRAAMEGRRDHIYQAAMFDPLTGATLTTDQIVDMCDELIEAHGIEKDGGYLPNIDAKKTLVPTSGKKFAKVEAKDLRASWDAAQAEKSRDFIAEWHVIGAFPGARKEFVSLTENTSVDADFAKHANGSVDLTLAHKAGDKMAKWQKATARETNGLVSFSSLYGNAEWSIGYAYTEVEETHGREVLMAAGSDDGIRVYINGQLVHEHEVGRGYSGPTDTFTASLKPGVNRIFVKLDNYKNGWGFGVKLPKANF